MRRITILVVILSWMTMQAVAVGFIEKDPFGRGSYNTSWGTSTLITESGAKHFETTLTLNEGFIPAGMTVDFDVNIFNQNDWWFGVDFVTRTTGPETTSDPVERKIITDYFYEIIKLIVEGNEMKASIDIWPINKIWYSATDYSSSNESSVTISWNGTYYDKSFADIFGNQGSLYLTSRDVPPNPGGTPVPEPSSLLLFSSLPFVLLRRKRAIN